MDTQKENTNISKRKLGENLVGVYGFFWTLAGFFAWPTITRALEGLNYPLEILMFIFTLVLTLVAFLVPIIASIHKHKNLTHAREIEEYNAKILQQKQNDKNTKTPM